MLRMRRCRNIRVLYILLLGGLTYFFLHYDLLPLPNPQVPQLATKYASRATYEYTSSYRLAANRTFEHVLDSQLLALERSIRSSLPTDEQNLLANLTIYQIATEKLAAQMSSWVKQWCTNNPGWTYNLLTTHPASLLSQYSSIPSIASAYEAYPSIRPDLTRYLMLWYYGGFYTDIDTWERVSLQHCSQIVDVTNAGREVSLMVGVEKDEPFYNQRTIQEMRWSRGFGFGTGTVWAPRRFDPVLRKAIVRALSHSDAQRRLVEERELDIFQGLGTLQEMERAEISGIGMFTDIVLEALSAGLKDGHELRDRDAGLERRVSWKKIKGLKSTLWLEPSQAKDEADMRGIAILPIEVWSNGQNHSSSGTFEAEAACVNHVWGAKSQKRWYEKLFW